PTTHDDPVYVVDDIVHYCVANMPGVVGLSSTIALTNATLRYGLLIAEHGLEQACRVSKALSMGLNLYLGKCVYKNVAESLNVKYTSLGSVLE
ncbi:MAG: alanine dehydrogenase, partial [Sedimentisphaerales bacterium]|nr:alanine dehydrogenase [Sedimentisphaerales bacterium]